LVGRFGPFKGPGILVVPIDEVADIGFELPDHVPGPGVRNTAGAFLLGGLFLGLTLLGLSFQPQSLFVSEKVHQSARVGS
jgi:hypothetical protein